MTFKLLGLSEEERLDWEQATGIKTEAAILIYEESVKESESRTRSKIRELQEVMGPHGSLKRVQAGNLRIAPGEGIQIRAGATTKTTIQNNGAVFIGSDLEFPSTTTEIFFTEEDVYNGEEFGAGDFLIGDNSTGQSNIKFDASSGQLQFRYGTTIKAYMDTDGSIKAGAGGITLDETGIVLTNASGKIHFWNAAGTLTPMRIIANASDFINIQNDTAGKGTVLTIFLTDASSPYVKWAEDASNANMAELQVNAGATPTVLVLGGDNNAEPNAGVVIYANKDGTETVFNANSYDIDFRIEGATDANLFKVDAGLDKVLISGYEPGWYVIEDINLTGGTQASFDFQSIPATFKHLKIELVGRSTLAASFADAVYLKVNNDTGNNYYGHLQYRTGTSEQTTAGAPFACTYVAAASSHTDLLSNAEITFFNYASTNAPKMFQSRGIDFENATAGGFWVYDGGGIWKTTGTAINRITLYFATASWAQYSRATLYGLK